MDGVEFRSVLSNLVNNAVESYGDNGGTVTVALSASDRNYSLSVIDNGCGMSTEQKEKLGLVQFSTKEGEDRGMGLHHAAQAAQSWGGRIKFHSELGVGTRVTVEVPRLERIGLFQKLSMLTG